MKRTIGIIFVVVFVLPILALAWLTTTESGLHWAFQRAQGYLPGKMTVGKLQGRLLGPIIATNLEYRQEGALIKTTQLTLKWSPVSLLTTYVRVNQLYLQSLSITLPESTQSESLQSQAIHLPTINLPWRIALKDTIINDLHLKQGERHIALQQVRLKANSLFSQVKIEELHLKADTFRFNIKGELQLRQNYHHELLTDWQVRLASGTTVKGHGQLVGDIKKTRLTQQVIGPLQATVHIVATDLLAQLRWHVQMENGHFDIARLNATWPAWTGKLSLKGRGDLGSANFTGSINSDSFDPRQPIDADFKLQLGWRNNGLDIADFNIHSGDAQINAQGRISKSLNLVWSASATDLAKLSTHTSGQFQAKGLISGPLATPMVAATLHGKSLSLPDYRIAGIDGTMAVDLFRWQQVKIGLAAQGLNIKGYVLQSAEVKADKQRLTAKAVSKTLTALIELKGHASADGWRGRIEQADVKTVSLGNWQLTKPVALHIAARTLQSDTLCWHNQQAARLCASIQHETQQWKSRLEISKLALMIFGPWLPPDLKLEGRVNATAELQLQSPDNLLGHADIELTPGTINYPQLEGHSDTWSYRGGKVTLKLQQQGLSANADIAVNNSDRLYLQMELPGAQLLSLDRQHQKVIAEAQLSIHDLGLLEALLPEVQELKGEVAISASAKGTLAQPRIHGQAHLLKGSLRIPRLGLNIDQLRLNSESDGFEKLDFHLDARSGDGTLAVQGQTTLDPGAGWPTQISIEGERFEVSRIPEARVLASPKLQINIQHHRLDIKGDIHIPQAKLQPKDTTMAERVSPDAVIIGSEQPSEERWTITTRVRLTLGDRVTFYGFGFEGRFGGSLLLEDQPGQVSTATGELSVLEGHYRAYGQNLSIEHGRLLYTGGPLTNPGLDLSAVRHIGDITSGLRVRGSLQQPKIELFSIPAMGQTDALSYLLLGVPIENTSSEQGSMMAKAALAIGLSGSDTIARTLGDQFGLDEMRIESSEKGDQAALVLGRYLSPRLYVGYGVGLLDAINTFTVRYQIADKWQLKAQSGEYQGADLIYTIDRN